MKKNRWFHVAFTYEGSEEIHVDSFELNEDEKVCYHTFYEKVDKSLNHYNGYHAGTIISWSEIE